MLRPGTVLDNKYVVEDVIGRGGFGHVYRARERLTDETVAIKELIPGLVNNPAMVQRFIQEARATLRLTHPNIARTHGIFKQGDTYYLAMEYLSGGSLADRLDAGPLPVDEALRVGADLCAALEHAHRKGVVHNDLKPGNVLFDARGGVRLADFGIAHVSEQFLEGQALTGTGPTFGTIQYMAPEQLEGVRDDPRVDVYALGALLYEMLAGRSYTDFEDDPTPAAQMRNMERIRSAAPGSVQAANPAVPDWLADVVARALSKTPDGRFASAAALQKALLRGAAPPAAPAVPREAPRPTIAAHAARPSPAPPTLPGSPLPAAAPRPARQPAPRPQPARQPASRPRPARQPAPRARPARSPQLWRRAALAGLVALVTLALCGGLGAIALVANRDGTPAGSASPAPTAPPGDTVLPFRPPPAGQAGSTPDTLPPSGASPSPQATAAPATTKVLPPTDTPPPTDAPAPTEPPAPTDAPPPATEEAPPPAGRDAERERELLGRVAWRPNGAPVFAYRAAQPPAIDGSLDEWAGHLYSIPFVVHEPANWQGDVDGSGTYYIAWDETHLYLGLRIRDEQHVQEAGGVEIYKGDDVEIQIDRDLAGDFDRAGLDDDDGQVGLAVRDFVAGLYEAYVWRPPAIEGPAAGVVMAARPAAGGYILEAALPWPVLNLSPQVETPYGFALSLSDNDTPGTQVQEGMVSTAPGRLWDDPRTWGTLVLVDW